MFDVAVINNTRISKGTYLLKVEKPMNDVVAGQCFNLGIMGAGVNREYSMCSDANADFLEFLIRDVDGGLVSQPLGELAVGQKVSLSGPFGEFCIGPLLPNKQSNFFFIATGTGVAPFRSFVKTYPKISYKIIHGVRHVDEVCPEEDFSKDSYFPCISKPEKSKPSRVTSWLQNNSVPSGAHVFICGNRKMISEAFELCREQGVHGNNIFTEVFF